MEVDRTRVCELLVVCRPESAAWVRPKDFDATVEGPFANERLGRQEHVKAVCCVIAEMNRPAVVALDGGWGTGQTAFLAMSMAWLQSEPHEHDESV